MLHSLEDLTDAVVAATDGEIGKVCKFLFDDESWTIRYLVVNVGNWLARRDVVIEVNAVELPDWKHKKFQTRLTRDQVRNSPDVDSKKPVSRQQEIALKEFYGWTTYWAGDENFPPSDEPAGEEFPAPPNEDPHLRSSEDVSGYQVWADGREMGRLEAFIVDETSWHIDYLDVKTGDWLRRRSMLVPTRWVKSISWGRHRVNLEEARTHI